MIRGYIAALLTIGIWSVTFVNTKALLTDFSALEIQVLRFAIGYLALWIVRPHLSRIDRRDRGIFAALGLTGVAVYQLMENCAIHYTNASNVAIMVSMCPIVTALLVRFFGRGTRLRPIFFVGCAAAIVGVTMVSLNGVSEFHFRPLGDILAVAAMLSWGVYSMIMSRLDNKGYDQIVVVRSMFAWALLFMLPLMAFGLTSTGRSVLSGSLAVDISLTENVRRFTSAINCFNLGFLGLLASAACFVLWNRASLRIGVVRCSVLLYLIPVLAAIFAYFCLNERMTLVSGFGSVLIIAGVMISGRGKRKK